MSFLTAWNAAFRVGNLRLWSIVCGAPFLTALALWLVEIIRKGWPLDRAEQQLAILGYALFGVLALVAIIVIALATVKVRATTPAGSLEVGGEDQ
jgi:hypothetical protein